ncbi:hypothetical protein [Calothrix sp. NIES-3974]
MASEVCQLHGGFLKVESTLKKGTTITLYLPTITAFLTKSPNHKE